jgi:hypothetical protein
MKAWAERKPLVILAALLMAACQVPQSAEPQPPNPPMDASPDKPAAANADDAVAFDAFVAKNPTPGQFRQRYPSVTLVLPGDIATKELRSDRSRYFADLDAQGRIVGGKFM